MNSIATILLPVPKLFPLDYLVSDNLELKIGDLVVVPYKNKELTGVVWDIKDHSDIARLKKVKEKAPLEYSLHPQLLSLIRKAGAYYLTPLGSIVKLVLPVDIAEKPVKLKTQPISAEILLPHLSPDQLLAFQQLKNADKPSILKGVTGCGKTEVYFHLIADYLREKKQIVVMLPEIGLGSQIIKRFNRRFGFEPVVWNSSISKAQKKMILRGVLGGEVKVIIGARSSLFLPYKNLGLIIVDEEHDTSYKQEDGVLYNARDMAVLRGNISGAKVILCSATPSIETVYNHQQGKYQLVELHSRYKEAVMPEVIIIDMKQEKLPAGAWLAEKLIASITTTLAKKEQVLLFLGRRGYCPLILCRICGYRFTCIRCSAWLVMHKSSSRLECHHCGYISRIHTSCPECLGSDSLVACGPGVERIFEEATRHFPNARIAVISKDQVSSPSHLEQLLHKIENNEIDIIIGTQMVTKGYHFPDLTLVGVIDADFGFTASDLRAAERTYQLLHQVGGRAGREEKKGKVFLQTYYPDNRVLQTLKNGLEQEFIAHELRSREEAGMPPFTKMASIIVTGRNEDKVLIMAKQIAATAPSTNRVRILGPAKAMMAKLAGRYRFRILIISDKNFNLQKYLHLLLNSHKIPSSCQIKVDIDPQSFF